MALWTPYVDTALDLSKPIKEEPRHEYPSEHHVYQFGYNYNYAPVPQISPLSGGSVNSVSSYEFTQRPLSPGRIPLSSQSREPLLSPRRMPILSPSRVPLSPPISPASQKRPYSSIEDSLSDDPDFQAFERDALRAMAEKNGGTLLGNNPRMRRAVGSNNESNDVSYRKQRERNNFAAKQSRDRRKLREIHLALKVSYLKKEVAELKAMLASRSCGRCSQRCLC